MTIPASTTISPAELRRMLTADPDVRILDVRTGAEFQQVHIQGSTNVPLDTLEEHTRELADTSHPIVLVCKSGARAGRAGSRLSGAGRSSRSLRARRCPRGPRTD